MGEVFAGRYELVDPIGRGGVGAVWRAWDHRRRRYVAAKVLQQSDAHALLRFVREQALRIDHPHVLAPASWAADDDKVLFTMDLVAGGSLAQVIGDYGPLPPRFVCTLLDQLLSGLAAVHAEGVVHRDIKPANILLEATGSGRPHLRLSDFGISMRKGEPRLTETDHVLGTPGYFAPEQMLGAEPDFTADLFAVGLVALYLLEGAKPDAKALIEHFAEHGTPGPPQGMPEPLWQVIATLLQPDPQSRFRTATGARKALASAAEMLPEPGPDDELVEIFDQLAPLPAGFGPEGPDGPEGPQSSDDPDVPDGLGGPVGVTQRLGPAAAHVLPCPHPDGPSSGHGQGSESGSGFSPGPASRSESGSGFSPGPASRSWSGARSSPGTSSGSGSGSSPGTTSGSGPGAVPAPASPLPPSPPRQPSTPTSTPAPASTRASAPAPIPAQPPTPSADTHTDTDSFRLPPPPPVRPPHPSTPPTPMPLRAPAPGPTHVPPPPPTAAHTPAARAPSGSTPAVHAPTPQRLPGPPAKVAVPMLLIALVCLAIGVWALTRL
ncbi:serine/threonine protein kinase [Streptomyces sp. G44]|uniref:serine/threonine-protein kinase n=1 Tax=Streptomyces sp. G44 TaxID=2807632 RepID=UPI001960BFF4|nr:serine/threonine-protein kinase [Streptomyces sp. G44]MBM7167198.1 serine/threonine protein kinase [Streptomyces sp. G44]